MTYGRTKLKDLYLDPSRNGGYKSKEFQGYGTPIVKMKEAFGNSIIKPQRYEFDRMQFSTTELKRLSLRSGDLLFCRTSVVPEGVGRCSILEDVSDDLVFESNLLRVRLDDTKVNPRFMNYYFGSPIGRGKVLAISNGVAVRTIRGSDLGELEIWLPRRVLQNRIADILSAYDDLIENNRRRIALLEQAARELYREWFVRLRFPGHEHVKIVDGVPEGWEKTTIGTKAPLHYGKGLTAQQRTPGDSLVFGSSGVVGTHSEFLVQGPGIIVGRKGTIGSVHWSDKNFWPIDTVYYVDPQHVSPFIQYTLETAQFINTDVAVPGLNRDFAHGREFLSPTKTLLGDFHDSVAPFRKQIAILSRQNEQLSTARDLLLPRLMNGSIPV